MRVLLYPHAGVVYVLPDPGGHALAWCTVYCKARRGTASALLRAAGGAAGASGGVYSKRNRKRRESCCYTTAYTRDRLQRTADEALYSTLTLQL